MHVHACKADPHFPPLQRMRLCASWRCSWQRPLTCRTRTASHRSRRPRAASAAWTRAPAGSSLPPSPTTTGAHHLAHQQGAHCSQPQLRSLPATGHHARRCLIRACCSRRCRKRAPYIAYLTRCRQGLQTSQAHLDRMLQRVLRDKDVANRYFTTVCVRLFLECMEAKLQGFITGECEWARVHSTFRESVCVWWCSLHCRQDVYVSVEV